MAIEKKSIIFVALALVILGISFLVADSDLSLTGLLVKGKADLTVNVIDGSNNHIVRDARVYVKDINKDEKATYVGRTNRNGYRKARLSESTYEVKVVSRGYESKTFSVLLRDGDERTINVVLFDSDYQVTCNEGTLASTCAEPQPWFCNWNGKLEERCDLCKCPQGLTCMLDGSCA